MGSWGTAIFSNDTSCDVRNEYNSIIGNGIDDETTLTVLKKFFSISETLCEDDADFWFAMAALQYKYGRLSDEVKDMTLQCIEHRFTMEGWFNKNDDKKRQDVLNKLKNDLLFGEKNPYKAPKIKRKKALGNIGDVLTYHLINSAPSEQSYGSWFLGKYILLNVYEIKFVPISFAMPDLPKDEYTHCAMYDWIGNEIPDISITKDLDFTYYLYLPQRNGGYNIRNEFSLSPSSKLKLRPSKYIFNLGHTLGKIHERIDCTTLQCVISMEDELHGTLLFDKEKNKRYREMVGLADN